MSLSVFVCGECNGIWSHFKLDGNNHPKEEINEAKCEKTRNEKDVKILRQIILGKYLSQSAYVTKYFDLSKRNRVVNKLR